MQAFSLSRDNKLPECVEIGKKWYDIRTEHTQILRILRMLEDPDVRERDKPILLRRMFFQKDAPRDVQGAFAWFMRRGDAEERPRGGEKDFDYEQDAAEIYAAFYAVYHIDLFAEPLHWWKFSALLEGLFASDNALSNKVRMRHIDDGEGAHKVALARAKTAAALKTASSAVALNVEAELRERLMNGLPFDDLLGGDE